MSLKTVYRNNPDKGVQQIWQRLDGRYGSPDLVHKSIMKKLDKFPRSASDTVKWFELADLLAEIKTSKEDSQYSSCLAHFESSVGISPILSKFHISVLEKWATRSNNYKKKTNMVFVPFSEFVAFVHDQARIRNDQCLSVGSDPMKRGSGKMCSNLEVQLPRQRPVLLVKRIILALVCVHYITRITV